MRNKKKIRNITLDFVYRFFSSFDISGAIWVLYMVYKGLSLWQIGLVEGIFHVASFLFEVPSGALADLFGRKRVILAGRICSAVSSLMLIGASELWQFAIAFVISAFGYNLNSGSEEAFVYDSMKEQNCENEYQKVNGKLEVVTEVSSAIAVFVGGILAEYSFYWCYVVSFAVGVCSMLPVLFFQETEHVKAETHDGLLCRNTQGTGCMEANAEGRMLSIKMWGKLSVGKLFCEHAKSCAVILKENRPIRYIITYYPAIDTFQSILFFYGQEYFSRFGLSKIAISLIMLIHGAASSLGAMSSNAITGLLGKRTRFVASLGVVTGYVLVSTENLAASLAGFWCVGIWTSVLRPLRSAELNAELPSGQRATILSVDSMIYSIFMLMLFPAVGFLADAVGLQMAFGTGSVLVLILVLCAGRRGELA